jgi:hypothetical protein
MASPPFEKQREIKKGGKERERERQREKKGERERELRKIPIPPKGQLPIQTVLNWHLGSVNGKEKGRLNHSHKKERELEVFFSNSAFKVH